MGLTDLEPAAAGGARIGFERKRPCPPGRVRLCLVASCSQPCGGARLCDEHLGPVAEDIAFDLQASGLDHEAWHIRVAIAPTLYLSFTDTRQSRVQYEPVHRVVARTMLGRPFVEGENVHHINGCKWDNAPTNLEVWVTSQPPGQRPADLASYARTLLSRYGSPEERALFSATDLRDGQETVKFFDSR